MSSATISGAPMPSHDWIKRARSHAEEVAVAVVAALLAWRWPYITERFAEQGGWSASGLYAAVFSWTSIQVGFLFAIYTFIVPRAEPFIKAVTGTAAFEAFKKYMLFSIYLTLGAAIGAFVLTVTNPAPGRSLVVGLLLIGWLSLTAYTLFRFLKVIRSFRKLERTRKP